MARISATLCLSTAAVFSAAATMASASGLIRCPDAAAIVASETVTQLRGTAPKVAFATRVSERVATVPGAPVQTSQLATPAACVVRRVTVKPGDTASGLAQTYMGNGALWPRLVAANPDLHGSTVLISGSQVSIPCTGPGYAPPGGSQIAAATVAALHSTAAPSGAAKKPVATQQAAPAVPAKPAPPPLPVWTARSGQFLITVVRAWARKAGYSVIVATNDDWKLEVPVSVQSTFEDALKTLVAGFQMNGAPPYIQLFPNHVLKIGGGM